MITAPNEMSMTANSLSDYNTYSLSITPPIVQMPKLFHSMVIDTATYCLQLSLKVVDQMLKLGWEGDGLQPLIKS